MNHWKKYQTVLINNVFLINTIENFDIEMLFLEKLFKNLGYEICGVVKNVTYEKLIQSVRFFKQKIHNKATIFIYYGWGFSYSNFIVTSDNYAIHLDEIKREFNYPIPYVNPHLFIQNICLLRDTKDIVFLDPTKENWNQHCRQIIQEDKSKFNAPALHNLCKKIIFNAKERLFNKCVQELPTTLMNDTREYIKIQNWINRKFMSNFFVVETPSIEDLSLLTCALSEIFSETENPKTLSYIESKLQDKMTVLSNYAKLSFLTRKTYNEF